MSPTETVSTLKLGTPPKGYVSVPPDWVLPGWKPRDIGPLVQKLSLLHQITHLPNSGAAALPQILYHPGADSSSTHYEIPQRRTQMGGVYAD